MEPVRQRYASSRETNRFTGYRAGDGGVADLQIYEQRHDKTNRKMRVRLAKTQISFIHADSEDSQTRRMPKLIGVFAGNTLIVLVLSCRASYVRSTADC